MRCLKCAMQKTWGFGVALQAHVPLHQICLQRRFWVPRMGVFEMCNAKKCGRLAWRSKRVDLCTKSARTHERIAFVELSPFAEGARDRFPNKSTRTSVFGYLGWGGLKRAVSDAPILGTPKRLCGQVWCRAHLHTCAQVPSSLGSGTSRCRRGGSGPAGRT